MTTKIVDNKGRLALGAAFAGRTVLVEQNADQIIITPAVVIPEREAWLYSNQAAQKLVQQGLSEARQGTISRNPPDLDADAALADQCRE